MIGIDPGSGIGRFQRDAIREINLDDYYSPYAQQAAFHRSPAPHRLLGGAAGPGKTLALIMDHLVACNEFGDPTEAQQVHTLLLRRTVPQLHATVVTRFREKVPRELYRDYNEQKKVITWLNGATTHLGSMQHEHDAWSWQGQWYKIGYDELGEFTFNQWQATAAWNRCPVSPYCTKDGASNPIGIGALWIKKLFVDHRPCDDMDEAQRAQYKPADYEYFPCTYLDNPVYANDPTFLKNLNSYTAPVRDALMHGKWGVAGGYFEGAWDPAVNLYNSELVKPETWDKRWISCNWGFEHWATIYWHFQDLNGVVRTYREVMVKHQPPEELAETIVKNTADADGSFAKFRGVILSHDAFASKATATMGANANSVAQRMTPILRAAGLPSPSPSTRDKLGREQLMYQLLAKRIRTGETAEGVPVMEAGWQIGNSCTALAERIPVAARDPQDAEMIIDTQTGDPLQGAGYGLYAIAGKPGQKPHQVEIAETLRGIADPSARHLTHVRLEAKFKQQNKPIRRAVDWRSKMEGQ